jgi:hypothetical protein
MVGDSEDSELDMIDDEQLPAGNEAEAGAKIMFAEFMRGVVPDEGGKERTKESAKNSRLRKKLYIELLEKKVV